jgi:hypothetical protein
VVRPALGWLPSRGHGPRLDTAALVLTSVVFPSSSAAAVGGLDPSSGASGHVVDATFSIGVGKSRYLAS